MSQWQAPEFISREQCIKDTEEVLGTPDIAIKSSEDIYRINVLGLDWDLGMVVHEPVDASKIPTGADGKKIGFFLLHGGSSDFKGIERHAKLLASKYGCRVIAGTFPGQILFSRCQTRLARRHDPRRRHGAHADLETRRIDHTGSVRSRQRSHQAQPLRHAYVGESQAGNNFLVSHGRLAGGVRRRHDRSLPAPLPRR